METGVLSRTAVLCWTIIAITTSFIASAHAAETPIFSPPSDLWIASKDKSQGVKYYGPTASAGRWYAAQWQNPGSDLPPFHAEKTSTGMTSYKTASPQASVEMTKSGDGAIFTLSQNGQSLPCELHNINGPHWEFDLFVSTSPGSVNPKIATALATQQNGLGDLIALRHDIDLEIANEWPPRPRTECIANQSNLLTAFVLHNAIANPPQTLFYQLALGTLCAPGPGIKQCEASRNKAAFFFTGTENRSKAGAIIGRTYGYRDVISSYGQHPLQSHERATFSIDILPRLKQVIGSGENGLDPEPSHWRLMNAYFGQSIWGNIGVTSQWSHYGLSAETR